VRHVTVVANNPPTASLGVTPSSGTAPLTVQADGSASSDTDGVVTSYTFDFGDGTVVGPQPGPQASHTFAAGTWTVRLTVTDDLGASGQTTGAVSVVPSEGGPNLVGNPSFETNTSGWSAYSGGTILRVAGGFDGAFSLRIVGPGAIGTFGLNDSPNWVASTPGSGTRYRITAWVRSDAPAGRVKLKIREYSQSLQVGPTYYSALLTLSPAWQSVTFDVVTQGPSGSTLDLQILDDAPLAPGEVFYVDNISIRIVP
jgi:PKD repeat protein